MSTALWHECTAEHWEYMRPNPDRYIALPEIGSPCELAYSGVTLKGCKPIDSHGILAKDVLNLVFTEASEVLHE